ncbi:MAG TPA: glycosyltransferase family 87 protein [Terrimicrobiaceae bacterium]
MNLDFPPLSSHDSMSSKKANLFEWVERLWNPAAIIAWTIALSAVIAKSLVLSDRLTNVDRYLGAGRAWIQGLPLYIYTPNKGFVYGPFSAVCYALASYWPAASDALWCLVSAALLLGGMWSMMTSGPFSQIPPQRRGLVFLLVLPLALGNFDSAQANAFLIGLIMIAFAAGCTERWTIAAIAMAIAVHWKVYPIVAGMLLVLLSPRRFTWRFFLALVIVGLIPFLFQKPSYVIDQYRLWYDTRTADNRLQYAINIAPWDLWFVLVRAAGIAISQPVYRVIQAIAGLAIAGFCLYGRVKHWPKERLFAGAFSLVCAWMTLLGPASELYTYLLVAPAVAFELVTRLSGRSKAVWQFLVFGAYLFLLMAILRVAFIPRVQSAYLFSLQPVGAFLFFLYSLQNYFGNSSWQPAFVGAGTRES